MKNKELITTEIIKRMSNDGYFSPELANQLDLFLTNTNLESNQKQKLLFLVRKIKEEKLK